MKTHQLLMIAFSATALVAISAPVFSQDKFTEENNEHRLQRIEKDLREVRSIVLQAKATGQPVEIRTASSDDQIAALQTKLDDIDQTVRGLTGQVETLTHDLDLARKDNAASHDQTAALADRLDKLEKQVAALAAPPPPPAPTAATSEGAAEAGDTTASPADGRVAYVNARQLMLNGDYPAAAKAFQDFIDTYGASPSVPAARYWLGEVKYALKDYNGAVVTLVRSIRNWPQTAWAPDAVIKLSLSLAELNKTDEACSALVEFKRHYPHATPAAKAQAAAAKARAACPG